MEPVLTFLAASPWTPCLVQLGAMGLAGAVWATRRRSGGDAAAAGCVPDPAGSPSRVQAAPARVPISESLIPDASPSPGISESRPGDAHEARAAPPKPRIIMSAAEQMRDFLTFMIVDGYAGRYSGAQWVASYADWAGERSIAPLPESIFLKLLGKHSLITKNRERIKDRTTGRVRRTGQKNSPDRKYFYTLHEPAPVAVAVPGRKSSSATAPAGRRAAGVSAGATQKRIAA